MSDKRFGWAWALGLAVYLLLPGARLQADEVELVSKIGPGVSPLDTASGESTTARDRDWAGMIAWYEIPVTTRRTMSADGRYVAYVSTAVNLVSGQQEGGLDRDVFLYDRATGLNTLVSRSAASPTIPAAGESYTPMISGDGRYVAFVSTARDLVPGQTDGNDDSYPPGYDRGEDVFLYDRDSGSVTLVSRTAASAVTTGNFRSRTPAISADGRYVAFASNASNLVAGQNDSSQSKDLFLYDRVSGTTALVSHAAGSATTAIGAYDATGPSDTEEYGPEISADGGFVAFLSGASSLFLYERSTGAVSLVSHAAGAPTAVRGASAGFGISSDGRYVAFTSSASDLVAGQTDSDLSSDVFLYDRQTDTHVLVSRMPGTATTAGGGWSASMDAGGDHVVFFSYGSLVAGQIDPNSTADLFVFDRAGGTVALVSRSSSSSSTTANDWSTGPVISADGSVVLFNSKATDLVAGLSDPNDSWDVFAYGVASETTTLVSRTTAAGTAADGPSLYPLVSADGRYVAFASDATDLVQGVDDLNEDRDVFLHDRTQQSTELVSRHGPGMGSLTPMAESSASGISADGRFVVFLSKADSLVSGQIDQNSANDVFLYDRVSGTTVLVSRIDGTSATTGNGEATAPSISADGNYVVFLSKSTNLVSGQVDGNLGDDTFLFERSSGDVILVSGAGQSAQTTADWISRGALISADGNWIVLLSEATNLVPGQVDRGNYQHLFLRDRLAGTTILVSGEQGSPTVEANNDAYAPSISADGRFIAFTSTASDLVEEMNGVSYDNREQIFVYDRASSDVQLVSFASGSPSTAANGRCYASRISADGRFVAFNSWGTNLVPGQEDTNSGSDFFLHDRLSGVTLLVTGAENSPTRTSTAGEGLVRKLSVSADGRYVAFESIAQDLVPGQVNNNNIGFWPGMDVFLFDRLTGLKALVSHAEDSLTATGPQSARLGGISADGNFVLFDSFDAKLYYVPLGNLTVVSRPNPPAAANGASAAVALNANGQFAVFDSLASNLVANDFNNAQDVFLYTRDLLPGRSFYTLTPCRVLDTRQPQDGPALTSGQTETLSLHGVCGIPATARAVAVNITVTQPTGTGHLVFYPGDVAAPAASTINFGPGQTRANNAILPLALNGLGTLKVSPALTGGGTVHLLLDVTGYFE